MEMKQRSVTNTAGIIDADPSSTDGTIAIMQHLDQLVPKRENGQPFSMCVSGDEMSCRNMKMAKRTMTRARHPSQRLTGHIETPGEFHKQGIMGTSQDDCIDGGILFK